MTDEIKVQDAGTADKAKLYAAIVIVIAGVAGYYYLASQPNWVRWLSVLASLGVAAVVVAFSIYGRALRAFVTLDRAKLGAAIVIVIAGIAGYYYLASQPNWVRWLVVLASLVLAALVLASSVYGREFREFVTLARVELRKIVWPARNETLMTTAVVFGFVIVFGVFFWVLDLVLAWATKTLTGQGGWSWR
jgi:preprotein translocase subunit SecE